MTGGDIPFSEEYPNVTVLDFADFALESIDDLYNITGFKQDAPALVGSPGQVLGLDADQNPVWLNQPNPESIIDDNAGLGDRTKVYSADYMSQVLGSMVDDIQDNTDYIKLVQSEFKNVVGFEFRAADSTSNSWRLAASGLAVQNNDYKFMKYKVVEGTTIYIKAAKNPINNSATFQFQNNSSVSSTSNPYLIGSPYLLDYDNIITVPTGATWLIISALKTDIETGVYNIVFDRNHYPVNNTLCENNLIKHACNLISDMTTALSDGYKIMEFDIRCTSDHIPVLSHNATITVGGQTYTIADETYTTLKTAYSSLVNLKEALYWCKIHNVVADVDVTKETYDDDDITTIVSYVNVTGMNGRCFITAAADDLRKMLAITRNLCVAASTISTTAMVDALRDIVLAATLTFCTRDYRYVDQTFVEYVHSKGILMKTWTPDTVADVQNMFDCGSDLIISNDIKPSDL